MFGAIYFGQTYFADIGQSLLPGLPPPIVGFITQPGQNQPTQDTGA